MVDPLADARAWYERAQVHILTCRDLLNDTQGKIWRIDEERTGDGRHIYSLRFAREVLVPVKPVTCEVANALFQALDNIIGAAARASGVERNMHISWPWRVEEDSEIGLPGHLKPAIDAKLKSLKKEGLPDAWLDLIRETFEAHRFGLSFIDVLKEVSLSGKHWELVETGMDAAAVAWLPKGAQHQIIKDVPKGHFAMNDAFVFHEGERISEAAIQIVIGIRLAASGKTLQAEPQAAFGYGVRFVETALAKAEAVFIGERR